ncbi:MAG: endonuclease III [Ferroplasma sp.]
MKNFNIIYEKIKKVAPEHHFEFTDSPFWILITTILSQRTKDITTDAAARALYIKYKDSYGLQNADPADIKKIIKNVGFSNVKSLRIIEIARIINDRYNGTVPDNYNELISLPGTGSKTANIVLTQGFKIPAIAVDTHVFRVSNRIGLVRAKTPEATEEALKKIIPPALQVEFNPVFVEFGKSICRPVSPKCNICPISGCCDYYNNTVKKLKKN